MFNTSYSHLIGTYGITSDGKGNIFVADNTNKRVCMMRADSKIQHTLLHNPHAAFFYHQAWIPALKKLVVRDQGSNLHVYDISYEPKLGPERLSLDSVSHPCFFSSNMSTTGSND